MTSEILFALMGSLFSGIIVFIVKGFFTNHTSMIEKTEHSLNNRLNLLESKIDKTSDKYTSVLNEVLIKFSNWEDRIKKY